MNETVGFIGLGVMGRPMAKHILAKGHKLVGCNRSRGPVDDIVKAGGTAAETPEIFRKSRRETPADGDEDDEDFF